MSGLTPGGDRPDHSGAKGLFAYDIQGQTPTYAKNDGDGRPDNYRDTLSRLFVRVDKNELEQFRASIPDPAISRAAVLDRLVGDPRGTKGYIDFILMSAQINFQELIQVGQALSGNYVAYAFDQSPVTIPLQGILINTRQDDQATYFMRLYLHVLRATALARRQKAVSLKVDSYILTGVLTAFGITLESKFETFVPFQASLLLKRLAIVEYTSGWRPTSVGTPFATDLNAVPMDSRIAVERPIHTSTTRTPNDLDEEIERGETDARVGETPAAPPVPTHTPEQLAQAEARVGVERVQSRLTVATNNVADLDRRANTQLSDAGAPGSPGHDERIRAYLETTAERDRARASLATLRTELASAQTTLTQADARLASAAPTPNTAPTPTPTPLPEGVRSSPAPETTGH